ncbi:MAG: acyl carrier protein [Lachnospiraceae bacterium]|nr:acyl carrier protein [Lachnospiraceae bacterium]MBQ1515947.1 acyl carrier protein [Lachnospiraceae bacterium]
MNTELEMIRNITAEVLQTDPALITPDASFRHDLFLYSTDIQALILYAETEFDVRIPDDRVTDIDSVRDLWEEIRQA